MWWWTAGSVGGHCGECGGGLRGGWWWTAGSVVVNCGECGGGLRGVWGGCPPSHPMSSAVLSVCVGAARR